MKTLSPSTARMLRSRPMGCSGWCESRITMSAQCVNRVSAMCMRIVGSVGLGGFAGTRRAIHHRVGIGIDSIVTYLIFECSGTEVAERQLETPSAALKVDLEGDQGVWSGLGGGRHDEIRPLLKSEGLAVDESEWEEKGGKTMAR